MRRMSYQDEARLEYGRILWKKAANRTRLIAHWTNPRHPYCSRFQEHRSLVEKLLSTPPGNDNTLDVQLQAEGWSLRALTREIPPVFGSLD